MTIDTPSPEIKEEVEKEYDPVKYFLDEIGKEGEISGRKIRERLLERVQEDREKFVDSFEDGRELAEEVIKDLERGRYGHFIKREIVLPLIFDSKEGEIVDQELAEVYIDDRIESLESSIRLEERHIVDIGEKQWDRRARYEHTKGAEAIDEKTYEIYVEILTRLQGGRERGEDKISETARKNVVYSINILKRRNTLLGMREEVGEREKKIRSFRQEIERLEKIKANLVNDR